MRALAYSGPMPNECSHRKNGSVLTCERCKEERVALAENAEPMDAPDYATEMDIDRAESEDITYREFGGLS